MPQEVIESWMQPSSHTQITVAYILQGIGADNFFICQ